MNNITKNVESAETPLEICLILVLFYVEAPLSQYRALYEGQFFVVEKNASKTFVNFIGNYGHTLPKLQHQKRLEY